MKLFRLFFLVLCLFGWKSVFLANEKCELYIIGDDTGQLLVQSEIHSKEENFISIKQGIFPLPCSFVDSIIITAPGYNDTLVNYSNSLDTIILKKNSLDLDELIIDSNGEKEKIYKIGRKNSFSRNNFSYGFGSKFASYVPNKSKNRKRIVESYIYISKKDSLPNLFISFYKNNNGHIGKLIIDKIELQNTEKPKGWHKLLLKKKIKLPANGFFIVSEQIDSDKITKIGLVKYKKTERIDSYVLMDNQNGITSQKFSSENTGTKVYFLVK